MTRAWNDEIWHVARRQVSQPDKHFTAWVGRAAQVAGDGKILDLGCGDGRYLKPLARAGAVVTGADQSQVALELARSTHPDFDFVQVADDCSTDLPDASFDVIWCVDTIEHVIDTQRILLECRRLMRPGASLFLSTPDHRIWTRLRLALHGWERHFEPMSPHLRFFTARSLRDLLDLAGLQIVELKRRDGQIRLVATR